MKKVLLLFFTIVLFASGILFANGNSSDVLKFSPDNAVQGYDVIQSTATITTFPWTEGFEGGALPTDWTQLYVSGAVGWTYQSGGYSSNPSGAHSGSYNALLFYSSSSRNQTKLITPDLDLSSLLNPQITFWHAQAAWGSDQDILRVYYRPASDSNWVLLAAYTSSITSWTEETISLASIPLTEPIYIAFEGDAAYGYGVVLDDITVQAGPTCPEPTALVASNLQTNSADLSWTAGSTETTWNIEYKLATDATWTLVSNVTTNPYTLPGLTTFSLYNWRVKAICGASDESTWSDASSFRTPCEAVTIFPVTEGFENASFPPDCWTVAHTQGSDSRTWVSGTSYYHTGYASAQLQDQYSGNKNNLVTPLLDIPTAAGYQVTFWINRNTTGTGCPNEGVKVWANSTPDTVGGTPLIYIRRSIDIAPTEAAMGWYEYSATIPDAGLQYIIFEGISDYCTSTYMDDITIGERPTCPKPENLQVSNITTTSVDLSWTETGTATMWNIEYGPAGFVPGMGTLISGVTNPYPLTGLAASMGYDFYVQADCGGSDLSLWSTKKTFRTACDNITLLPYTENFDTYGTAYGTFPSCWFRPATYDVYPAVSTSYFQSSPASLMFNTRTSTIALTPPLDLNIESLQISFWLKMESTSSSGVFQVGVMANDTDITTFDTIMTITTVTTDWIYYEISLSSTQYTGTGYHVAFKHITPNNYWYWLDDVMIDFIPTCPKPDSVIASNITTTSFDVSWVERGTATLWNIEYGPAGFTQGTGTVVYGVTNPYPITGLSPSTAYDVYVQADCGGSDLSYWTFRKTFRTLCDNVSAVPYIENFDSYGTASGVFPDCWSRPVSYNNYGTIYPSLGNYTYYSSPAGLLFASDPYTPTYALTPAFDISIDSLQVSFWLKADNITYSGAIQIGIMANDTDITTFDTITTIVPSSSNWTYYEIALNTSQYVGTGYHIAFKHANPTYYYYYYYLDNVIVDYIPDCIRPDNIVFSNATPNSVDVSWNERGSATSWNIEYGPAGFVQGSGTLSLGVTNPYTIPGLNPSTLYDFYVQSDCGGSSSYWTEVETFTTTQIPFVAPGTIDFEDTLENSNWSFVNGTATNKWYIGTGANNTVGGANGLFISNNYGVANVYDNYSNSHVWAYRDIQFTPTTGEYQLKFDWRALAESCCDYIIVYVGNPQTVAASSDYNYVFPTTLTQIGQYNNQSTWQSDSVVLDATYSGATKRLYFLWHNDGSLGPNPPGAIDNIVITDIPCATINNLGVSGITTNSANVNWNPANAESAWDIVYDTAGFDPSLGTIIALTDTTYAISGLLPNTNYDVYVRANCGTTTGNWVLVNFSTECVAFTTLPFFEGFETTSQSLNCWRIVDGNNDGDTWNIYTGSGYEHSGTQFAGIYTDGNGGMNNDYLITPNILLTGNQFLSFYHRPYSTYEPNDYRVLLSTTGSDPADFTTVLFTDTSTLATYDEVVLDLSAYSGNVYIAFHIPQGGLDGWYLFIDDVTIDTWPTCPSPIALTVSNVTANSASLAWTSRGTETAWEVQYKLNTDATWTAVQANTNPYPLTGLVDASCYEVKVRAVCGPADSSYFSNTASFCTSCFAFNTFPYTKGFENGGAIPACWSESIVSGSAHWAYQAGGYSGNPSGANTGSYNAYLYYSGSGNVSKLISPTFDFTNVTNPKLSFWHAQASWAGDQDMLTVYYRVSPADPWVQLMSFTNSITTWQFDSISLPNTSATYSIAFEGDAEYGYGVVLDDITIDGYTAPQDTCDNPINLAIPTATLGCDSAIVNWAAGGNETMWTFEYKRNADPDYTSVVVTTPTYTMMGLMQLTQYNVRVKALCGASDESGYTTANFTTPQCGVTSYIITASASSGGAISPSGAISVIAGGNQAFTMTPDDTSHVLASLVVDGVVSSPQSVYSFNGVNADHTIHAVFEHVGINENNLQNSVIIFPNPANDLLNVKLSQEFESVEITNMLGQLLYSNKVTDSFLQIDISSYTSGVYFIRLKGENGLATKKFIKE